MNNNPYKIDFENQVQIDPKSHFRRLRIVLKFYEKS